MPFALLGPGSSGLSGSVSPAGEPSPTIVVDAGGSNLRYGVVDGGYRVSVLSTQATPRANSEAGHPFESLAASIAAGARQISEATGIRRVALSLGAAIDQRSGALVGSGPMWGGGGGLGVTPVAMLEAQAPELAWHVVNDLTAHACGLLRTEALEGIRKFSVLNIGTGIAFRTLVVDPVGVWVDAVCGLQGELGHLPASFTIDGRSVDRECECGAWNHLSSFCAGSAIPDIIAGLEPSRFPFASGSDALKQFSDALARSDSGALDLLHALAEPVAVALRNVCAIDPEIERIFLVGGVSSGLGEVYAARIRQRVLPFLAPYRANPSGAGHDDLLVRVQSSDTALVGAAVSAHLARPFSSGAPAWKMRVRRTVEFSVLRNRGLFGRPDEFCSAVSSHLTTGWAERLIVFADSNLPTFTLEAVARAFGTVAQQRVVRLTVSELTKNGELLNAVLDQMDTSGLPKSLVGTVAVGGGVLLDAVGLAASLYRRGVPYIRVPTTLLSSIDAGIALKTGINLHDHRNRVGSFHPSLLSIIDLDLLRGLDDQQYSFGLAEALKIGMIGDGRILELIESLSTVRTDGSEDELVGRSIEGMLSELAADPYETTHVRNVDLGHSFISGLEFGVHRWPHGKAVAFDLLLSSAIALQRRLISDGSWRRIAGIVSGLNIDFRTAVVDVDVLQASLAAVAEHRCGPRVPVPGAIPGPTVILDDISKEELRSALSMTLAALGVEE